MAAGVELTIDQRELARLSERLHAQADGKALRRQLSAQLRKAVAPAVAQIKSTAGGMGRHTPAAPTSREKYAGGGSSQSLGAAIAKGIGVRSRLSGPLVGVSVRATKKGNPRGFRNAPRRFNDRSFRHPVFGSGRWVEQASPIPDYFDGPLRTGRSMYRLACITAINEMSARIAR